MSGIDIVTGGSGFIGSHLVERLISIGRTVKVIDINTPPNILSDKVNYLEYDIRDTAIRGLFDDVDNVYHIAGLADIVPSIENPLEYYEVNANGTLHVLESAKRANVKKFIYAASSSCYGSRNKYPNENDKCNPEYPYAITKYIGEQLVTHWSRVYKIPAISLRLFNVYGKRSRTTGNYGAVIGTFLSQIKAGKRVTIVGDGMQTRDFIHIDDVIDAFIKASQSDKRGIFNIGSGRETSINYLAELLGATNKVNIPKRPGEPDNMRANILAAKAVLNWEPKISIENGIKQLLKDTSWIDGAPVWTPESIEKQTKKWFECLSK